MRLNCPWKAELGREMFHTLFAVPVQGLGLTCGSALLALTTRATVKQRPARIRMAGARQRGQSVLCACGGDVPMFWAWRDASPATIVCLLTMVLVGSQPQPAKAKLRQQGCICI